MCEKKRKSEFDERKACVYSPSSITIDFVTVRAREVKKEEVEVILTMEHFRSDRSELNISGRRTQ